MHWILVSGFVFSFCTDVVVSKSFVNHNTQRRGNVHSTERSSQSSSLAALIIPPPFKRIRDDYVALTQRATARHILLPTDDSALSLKQKIRNRASSKNNDDRMYLEDAFAAAACRHSMDDETAVRGGLLGTSAPQGRLCGHESPELDRACFELPLGEVCGPIRSGHGWHLVLVTERTGLGNERKDDGKTRITRGGEDDRDTVFLGPAEIIETNVGLVMGMSFAGWISTEVIANAVIANVAGIPL